MADHYALGISGVANPKPKKPKKKKRSATMARTKTRRKRRMPPRGKNGRFLKKGSARRSAARRNPRKPGRKKGRPPLRSAYYGKAATRKKAKRTRRAILVTPTEEIRINRRRNPKRRRRASTSRRRRGYKMERRNPSRRRRRRRNPSIGGINVDFSMLGGIVAGAIGLQYLKALFLGQRSSYGVAGAAVMGAFGIGASLALDFIGKKTGISYLRKLAKPVQIATAAQVGFALADELVYRLPTPSVPILARVAPSYFAEDIYGVAGVGEDIYGLGMDPNMPAHLSGAGSLPSHLEEDIYGMAGLG